jgi:hypothetical protein
MDWSADRKAGVRFYGLLCDLLECRLYLEGQKTHCIVFSRKASDWSRLLCVRWTGNK